MAYIEKPGEPSPHMAGQYRIRNDMVVEYRCTDCQEYFVGKAVSETCEHVNAEMIGYSIGGNVYCM